LTLAAYLLLMLFVSPFRPDFCLPDQFFDDNHVLLVLGALKTKDNYC